MNHPIAQLLLLLLAVWMLLVLSQRMLGNAAIVVIVVVASLISINLYLLRFQRPLLARAYQIPVFKQVIDGVCRLTANQSPIESNEQSTLPAEITLREARDFPWAARKLKHKVIALDTAIDTMIRCLRDRIALRTRSPGSTQTALATFLFIGPDGIGKRHLARSLASLLYREGRITEFDLSDIGYQQDGVATLFGSTTSEGQLLQSVRRFPHQVLMLENIDRAASPVHASLQNILRHGTCCDPRSRAIVSFEHVTLIATISSTLLGLSDETGSPVDTEQWESRLSETLTAEFGLEPTFTGLFNECVLGDHPGPLDQARVIALLIREQCELYGLEIDYVDPEIIADEVARYRKSHGFQLVKTRLAGRLEVPILQAKQNDQKRIILTTQSWNRGATKELNL